MNKLVLALLLMTGCLHPKSSPTPTLPRKPNLMEDVVLFFIGEPVPRSTVMQTTVWCTNPVIPDVPELEPMSSSTDEPDVIARVMIHRRDFEAHLAYEKQLRYIIKEQITCIQNVIEVLRVKE